MFHHFANLVRLPAVLVFLILLSPAWAHDNNRTSDHHAIPQFLSEDYRARAYFTDLPVITQSGQKKRFYSDILKDRVVLISLFYTNCTAMCPIVNVTLGEVQDLLGDDLGRKIHLISITLDPDTDTPEVLKDYATNVGAKDGWLFLTGIPDNINTITRRLGQTSSDYEKHSPYLMVGNVGIARWSKVLGNVTPEIIAARLRLMAEYSSED